MVGLWMELPVFPGLLCFLNKIGRAEGSRTWHFSWGLVDKCQCGLEWWCRLELQLQLAGPSDFVKGIFPVGRLDITACRLAGIKINDKYFGAFLLNLIQWGMLEYILCKHYISFVIFTVLFDWLSSLILVPFLNVNTIFSLMCFQVWLHIVSYTSMPLIFFFACFVFSFGGELTFIYGIMFLSYSMN